MAKAKKKPAGAKRQPKTKHETALILRTCDASLRSHGGFQWPGKIGSAVSAPDWKEDAHCGNGLHGWLYGQGDNSCSNSALNPDAKWIVVEAALSEIVMLVGKCKFPRCTIRHIGDKKSATDFIIANEPRAKTVAVIGANVSTTADGGIAFVGDLGTATAGYGGTATAGARGMAIAGDLGTATAGARGTATAGARGTATAGECGTATAGDGGTATAGDGGTATAGDGGELRIRWYDFAKERYRTEIAYVGEDGIKPNVPYRLDDKHQFVKVVK